MKQSKKLKGAFGATPPPAGNEKKRLMIMGGAFVVLLSVFIWKLPDATKGKQAVDPAASEVQAPKFKIPELHPDEVDALAKDATEAGRSTLEPGLIDIALDDADKLAEPHYNAMKTPDANAETIAALEADLTAARQKPLRLRGFVLSMRERTREDNKPYKTGLLVLDDGSPAFYAVSRLADKDLGVGSAVRVDGLFVKMMRDEVDGTWFEGPLVAGREMIRSFPALYTESGDHGPFTEAELANIHNDDIESGIGTLPFEEKWKLMARAKLLKEGEINWDEVPVLDAATLSDILENGDKWRGQPIRLPEDGAALMTSASSPAGENPARITTETEGWLADNSWLNLAPAVEFLAPFGVTIPDEKDPTVLGRGFVFKNLSYRSSGTGVRLTPVLVLSELTPMARPDESIFGYMMAGVAGISVLLGIGIFLLLRRDNRQSREFQAQRRERARKRREAQEKGGSTPASTS